MRLRLIPKIGVSRLYLRRLRCQHMLCHVLRILSLGLRRLMLQLHARHLRFQLLDL